MSTVVRLCITHRCTLLKLLRRLWSRSPSLSPCSCWMPCSAQGRTPSNTQIQPWTTHTHKSNKGTTCSRRLVNDMGIRTSVTPPLRKWRCLPPSLKRALNHGDCSSDQLKVSKAAVTLPNITAFSPNKHDTQIYILYWEQAVISTRTRTWQRDDKQLL